MPTCTLSLTALAPSPNFWMFLQNKVFVFVFLLYVIHGVDLTTSYPWRGVPPSRKWDSKICLLPTTEVRDQLLAQCERDMNSFRPQGAC